MKIKVAAAVVTAVAFTAAPVFNSSSRDEVSTHSAGGQPVILTSSASTGFRQRPLTEQELKRRRQAILRATREFTRVYHRYQLGDLTSGSRRQMRVVTTPSFAQELERQPARAPESVRPTRSRTLDITLYGDPARESVSVEVRTAYERTGQTLLSVMFVVLERQGQSWRVSGIR